MSTRLPRQPMRALPEFNREEIMASHEALVDYVARLHKYLENQRTDVHGQIAELDDAMPGDRRDRVRVRSRGPNVEFKVSLPKRMLMRRPDAYEVVNQTGPGNVWPKGGTLRVENRQVTFLSSAPPGVEFTVRLLEVGADDEEKGAPLEPSDDIVESVADIENAGDGSGEQDDWTE